MKAADIKVGNIYYVNYEPVRQGEFGKKYSGLSNLNHLFERLTK